MQYFWNLLLNWKLVYVYLYLFGSFFIYTHMIV